MKFLDNLDLFQGTGERNAQGQTLEEFLSKYDAKKYDCPSNTVDMLVFRSPEPYRKPDQPLKLLMVKRSNHPSIGAWACPGGFVNLREDMIDAARRELEEETGVTDVPLIQLRTWGNWERDPRWRVITTAWLALVEGDLSVKAGDDAADAGWFDVDLTSLSHKEDGDTVTEQWQLTLTSPVKNLKLTSEVEKTTKRRGILKETGYRLLANNGVASDHGCLIADAVLYLREQCGR